MKRFLFAAVLVALAASVGTADEKPTVATPATPAAPVVITTAGTPVAEYSPAQSTRRGLFGRLRSRNSASAYSTTPVMTAPTTATPMTPTPMPPTTAPQPMPMPGTRTGSSTAAPMMGTIVQASGSLPAGTYTTTDGTIVQIGATEPMSEPMTETQSGRRGLFGRRNR